MNKKVLELIAGTLKLDAEKLAKSLSSENEDEQLDLPKFFTDSDIDAIKENVGKERYDAGAKASREMLFKELSDTSGIERVKTREEFLKNYKDSILESASIEPNKKVEELNLSLQRLQRVVEEKENEITTIKDTYKQKEVKFKASSIIPDLSETIGLTKDEAVSLFFMNHESKEDGIYKDGQILKDNHEKPLDLETAVKGFVSEKGWDKPTAPTGRGGGSGKPTGSTGLPSSLSEFETYVKDKGLTMGSEQANALLNQMAKENPDILN